MSRHKSYTDDQLRTAVAESKSFLEVARRLGLSSGGESQRYIKMHVQRLGLDTSHFLGQGYLKGGTPSNKRTDASDLLVQGRSYSTHRLKNLLFELGLKEKRCERCGRKSWLLSQIPLELHHIDGDRTNNELGNLQILCPNCHAQTDNHAGKAKRLER